MNLGLQSHNNLLHVNFNQDATCLVVCTRSGLKIYNCDPFGRCYNKDDPGIGITEMLFSTSLIVNVFSGEQPNFSSRKLEIFNTKRQTSICELTFVSSILNVKINRKILVVLLEEHIYLYAISNMKLLHTIDTAPNPHGLIALSPSSDNCYVAYPTNTSGPMGTLMIFDANSMQPVNVIQAHKSPLSCITFSQDGSLLATASDKGTVIRVFSIPSAQKLHQFRRGTYPAKVYSLAFSSDNNFLAVSSDTDTLHIFKLAKDDSQVQPNAPPSLERKRSVYDKLTSPLSPLSSAVSSFLPDKITEIWEPERDFAHVKMPSNMKPGTKNICAISPLSSQGGVMLLIVVSSEGDVYMFGFDEKKGGECSLLKQYSIMDDNRS